MEETLIQIPETWKTFLENNLNVSIDDETISRIELTYYLPEKKDGPTKDVDILLVQQFVEKHYGVELIPNNKTRKRKYCFPRQMFMYLCYKYQMYVKKSLSKIGYAIGKDHSTTLHAFKVINNFIRFNAEKREEIYLVEKTFCIKFGLRMIWNNK